MAVLAFTSAKGAPGVSTTVLACALSWPRPVLLLEADTAGSSSVLAGYLRGAQRHDKSLVDLALAHRRGALSTGLHEASIPLPNSQARLLAGLASPAQAPTVQPIWEPLAAALVGLEQTGTDVLVDAGRLGTEHGPTALLRASDLLLLTTRTTLPAIAATRARAAALREDLSSHGGGDALQLLLVGEGQPYTAREITAATGVPVAASVAWDPVNAEVFSIGAPPGRRHDTSALLRSVRTAAASIRDLASTRRDRLAPATALRNGDRTHA